LFTGSKAMQRTPLPGGESFGLISVQASALYTLAEGEPTTISVTSVYGNPEGLSSRQGTQL